MSKLKIFEDDISNVAQTVEIILERTGKLWRQEKTLVTSIFSFSCDVFESFLSEAAENKILSL